MKQLIYILLLILSSHSFANYLKCIGAEEAKIHNQRIGGAYKELNRSIINELAMFTESIRMNNELEAKICSPKTPKPSLELIRAVFLNKNVFYTRTKHSDLKQLSIDNFSITGFKKKSFYIFIQYLSSLQAELKDPQCINKEFPGLHNFYTRAQYILEDVGMEKLISEIPEKKKVFDKLQTQSWKTNCL